MDEEKRLYAGLTDEQVKVIKNQILASIYEDIGRSLFKKILWTIGAVFFALLAWLGANGHVTLK